MSAERPKKASSLLQAFKYALTGIAETFKQERNIKIEAAVGLCALVASFLLDLEPVEWAVIITLIVVVLALELANSALESLVDLVSPDVHPLAKYAKDAMSGAVLIASIGAAAAGLVLFIAAALR